MVEQPADAAAAPEAPGGQPWDLAPAGAAIGLVVGPGALGRIGDGWAELDRILAGADETRGWRAAVAGAARTLLPVAGLDRAHLVAAGLDPDGAAALFLDGRAAPLLALLPVVDEDKLAAATGARRGDGGTWRGVAGLTCARRPVGFVCAGDVAAIDAALAPGDRPLRRRVAALPSEQRGDVELVADLAAMPDMVGVRERLHPILADAGVVAIALRAGDDVTLRLWVEGKPMPPWAALLDDPAPLPGLDLLEQGAPAALRWRFDLPTLIAFALPPTAVPERPDLAAVLAELFSGDVTVASRGSGAFAGQLAIGVVDAARARAALPALCPLLAGLGAVQRTGPDSCTVVVDVPAELARDPLASAMLELARGTRVALVVDGGALRVSAGAVGGAEPAPAAALGAEPWQLRGWGFTLDPLLGLDAAVRARVDRRLAELPVAARDRLAAIRWLADHAAAAAIGVRFDARGFHLLVSVSPLASDPPAAYDAFTAALARQRSGDIDGFRAALAALPADYPGTRAATSARLILNGAPALGPAGVVGIAVMAPLLGSRVDAPARDRR